MSINLTKHRNALLDAWKDVVDDKTPCNWALFGYEKQSYDLCIVDKGDGGLEELADELNSGKIMYAFCRVTDPNTGLPKFVFINWQDEGAPLNRKGACASHVYEVSKFFKGAHVTINARMEDDVEPALILEKVTKASASKFNFKERSEPVKNMAPVGSVYKRIMPTREINPVEREKFWMKEQEEGKKRIFEEKKKADEERKKLEEERKERENPESPPLLCRSVRVGSYRILAKGNNQKMSVYLGMEGISFNAPMVSDPNKMVNVILKPNDVTHMVVHFGKCLPILFVFTTTSFAECIRKSLDMSTSDFPYYDPTSNDEKQKKITFLIDIVTDDQRHFLRSEFLSESKVKEVDQKTANEILVKSSPSQSTGT